MKRIINFSHPLGEKASKQIEETIGEFEEVCIKCHFDIKSKGVRFAPQLEELIDAANIQAGDYIIPPALSIASFLLGAALSQRHLAIWVKMEDGVWVLGNIE